MASLGISEFTFGFAFLHEQVLAHPGGLRVAPVLPSLQAEAQLGWDAHLPTHGTDFYYQFKLSDYLQRRNATYIRDGIYNGPYFRIKLHSHHYNRQHRRLRAHSSIHPHTYYVAPEVESDREFNAAFLNSQITSRSRVIPVSQCCDYSQFDDDQHFITFQSGQNGFKCHSEESEGEGDVSGANIGELYLSTRNSWREIDEGFARDALFRARRAVEITREEDYEPRYRREAEMGSTSRRVIAEASPRQRLLMEASELMATYFGLAMVLVGPRP